MKGFGLGRFAVARNRLYGAHFTERATAANGLVCCQVAPTRRRCRPAPACIWTRNFVAGTFLNFFIAAL